MVLDGDDEQVVVLNSVVDEYSSCVQVLMTDYWTDYSVLPSEDSSEFSANVESEGLMMNRQSKRTVLKVVSSSRIDDGELEAKMKNSILRLK